jgi:transcription elongation factor GreB
MPFREATLKRFRAHIRDWLSPIAKAVMNARVGERVCLKLPTGDQELEILSITYG